MKKLVKIAGLGALVLALLAGGLLLWAYKPVPTFGPPEHSAAAPDYWPTTGWRSATPEQQGMDSERLLAMLEAYETEAVENPELYIDSMTVIRDGYVVADIYPNPRFPRGEMHVIHSVTKSVVSALVGIAIEEGFLSGTDALVVEFFPDRTFANLDDRKRALTVADLLSMETGLHSRDSYLYAHEGLFAIQHSDDWLQFALDLPMTAEPGERFDYSNISTFLLAAILERSTGEDPLSFAKTHLFGPLGIDTVQWEWNSEGIPIAWARMWLTPQDMAKLGLLYLQHGRWDGEQVLPEAWVRESLTPHAYPQNVVYLLNEDMSVNDEASDQNWIAQRFFRPFADGYGYQWWLDREGPFTALGTGGQYIAVAPEENIVFVVTSKSRGLAQFFPATLFFDHVLKAVRSDAPLPPNASASDELARRSGPPPVPEEARTTTTLPATAARVSGVTYALESNPFNTNNLRFVFEPGASHAELSYTARESWVVDFRVGLDGVRRDTQTPISTFSAVGEWTGPNTFLLTNEIIGYSTFDTWEFSFVEDRVQVTERSISGDYVYEGQANPAPAASPPVTP
ncbi:MAG: serine hydrolase [Deltaproteobacteria bacterium]|nr:serine hydrolase [Deltaproteobacteria bacterium]